MNKQELVWFIAYAENIGETSVEKALEGFKRDYPLYTKA